MTTITCPTGLQVDLREMLVREERILSDRALARDNRTMETLLSVCTVGCVDPGPYEFPGDAVDWGRVLQGDRFYALMQLRIITFGPTFTFQHVCTQRNCRERFDWEFSLTELAVRKLSKEGLDLFRAGNRFESAPLPRCGKRVWFRLLTGFDERKIPLIQKNAKERAASALLAFRTLEVEGIDPKDTRAKRAFFEDLSMGDADFLTDEFDRADCGVETSIDVECPECFAEQTVDIPFGPTFFMPGRKRTERRKASRAKADLRLVEPETTEEEPETTGTEEAIDEA